MVPKSREPGTETSLRHLNQTEVARRWQISPRTLEAWRWLKQGPAYLKIGGRVLYKIEDVETFEAEQRRGTSFDVENHPEANRP